MEEAPLSPLPKQGPDNGEAPHQGGAGGLPPPARAPGQRGRDKAKRRSPRRLVPSAEEIAALGPIEASRRYIFGKLSLTCFDLAWQGFAPKDISFILGEDCNKVKVTLSKLRKRRLYVPSFALGLPKRENVIRLFIKLMHQPSYTTYYHAHNHMDKIYATICDRLDLSDHAARIAINTAIIGPCPTLDPALRLALVDAYILFWERANPSKSKDTIVERLRSLQQQLHDQFEQAAPTCPSPHPGPAQQHCG